MSCSHDPQSLSKLELLPLSEKKKERMMSEVKWEGRVGTDY